jgi:hypothetical protein
MWRRERIPQGGRRSLPPFSGTKPENALLLPAVMEKFHMPSA